MDPIGLRSVGDGPLVVLLMGQGDEQYQLLCHLVAPDNGNLEDILHVPGEF